MFRFHDAPGYRIPSDPTTDFERRVVGVMPLLTREARRFLRRLPARARGRVELEDILQDLLLALLERHRLYDPAKSRFTTWSTMIARQTLIDLGDVLCRGPGREALELDPCDDRGETPDESAVRAEARQRVRQAVRGAIERLDDRRYFVLTATYGIDREPMSVMDLSEWLARSPSQVIGYRTEAEDQVRAALAG